MYISWPKEQCFLCLSVAIQVQIEKMHYFFKYSQLLDVYQQNWIYIDDELGRIYLNWKLHLLWNLSHSAATYCYVLLESSVLRPPLTWFQELLGQSSLNLICIICMVRERNSIHFMTIPQDNFWVKIVNKLISSKKFYLLLGIDQI